MTVAASNELNRDSVWPQGMLAWFQILGSVCGVGGMVFMAGMTVGPMRTIPAQIDDLDDKLSLYDADLVRLKYDMETQKRDSVAIHARIDAAEKDRALLRDILSKVELIAANSLSKLEFVEWKAQLQHENPKLEAPPLIIKPPR